MNERGVNRENTAISVARLDERVKSMDKHLAESMLSVNSTLTTMFSELTILRDLNHMMDSHKKEFKKMDKRMDNVADKKDFENLVHEVDAVKITAEKASQDIHGTKMISLGMSLTAGVLAPIVYTLVFFILKHYKP